MKKCLYLLLILFLNSVAIFAATKENKNIYFVASDFQNGGVTAIYRNFEDAAKVLGWKVIVENGKSDHNIQREILSRILQHAPDGIIIAGFSLNDFPDLIAEAKKSKIVMVGWHAAASPGPAPGLFTNITTNADDVATMAAEFAIQDAKKNNSKMGVIIFNDKQYAIAKLKTEKMKETISKCKGYQNCKVLSVENVPIAEAKNNIPEILPKLNSRYGKEWTYALAINDIYFDSAYYPLQFLKRTDIKLISAGDGSESAIERIRSGKSNQIATIAEPLRLQAFQIADEFKRAFSGGKQSGKVFKPLLITKERLKTLDM
jgi:ribose transport system substrate-binding protein